MYLALRTFVKDGHYRYKDGRFFEESWIFIVRGKTQVRGKAQVRENPELIRKFIYERVVEAGLCLSLAWGIASYLRAREGKNEYFRKTRYRENISQDRIYHHLSTLYLELVILSKIYATFI